MTKKVRLVVSSLMSDDQQLVIVGTRMLLWHLACINHPPTMLLIHICLISHGSVLLAVRGQCPSFPHVTLTHTCNTHTWALASCAHVLGS